MFEKDRGRKRDEPPQTIVKPRLTPKKADAVIGGTGKKLFIMNCMNCCR